MEIFPWTYPCDQTVMVRGIANIPSFCKFGNFFYTQRSLLLFLCHYVAMEVSLASGITL